MPHIPKEEPLTQEEIDGGIFDRAANGSQKDRDRIVLSCTGICYAIARKRRGNLPTADLASAAFLGITEAVDKYRPGLGYKFTTLASWWANKHVLALVIGNHAPVSFDKTDNDRRLFFRLRREERRLLGLVGFSDNATIARLLDVTEKEVENMQSALSGSPSLDARNPVDEGASLLDRLASPGASPEEITIRKGQIEWCQARMVEFEQGLDADENAVWQGRIAREHQDRLTAQDVGDQIGKSKQWVSQTEAKLVERFAASARRDERKNEGRIIRRRVSKAQR